MPTTHHVEIDLDILVMLVNEVAQEDPLDYGHLPVDEMALRHSCCLGAMNILKNAAMFKAEDLVYVLLSSMAKLIEENVLLHAQNIEHGEQIRSELVRHILLKAKHGRPNQ